ncbi:hypothetical protein C2G38_2181614 [Gigaspora rosea]|uniref:Uncharacterized protein n=1 Tax=Gigaspora rosea TaxID=44941 RepID=A0A397VBW8_9GLOM|nr:hypothetical protein C2G38_2181614 [Gigaspora rosea]
MIGYENLFKRQLGTSGNKDVDDYIKEIQFKATEYGFVVEWSPFNRSNNIQKTSEVNPVQHFVNMASISEIRLDNT